MNNILATTKKIFSDLWSSANERAANLSHKHLAWGSLALAAIILLCVNLTSSIAMRGFKADLTEDSLYTISPGTRTVLSTLDEPIRTRIYFSRKLGEAAPSYARYFERIRALLEQYQDISGGKLVLEFLDPEAFSDSEDMAVAAGLRGVRLNAEGEVGYFGLVANNATDNEEIITFFQPDRENFVEYDITKLIHTLANPEKKTIGLITSLPIDGGTAPQMMMNPQAQQQQQTPPWLIMSQIREFFDVETLGQDLTSIPEKIDVLMVAQPTQMTPKAAYAIDQFALKGGKVLVFIDPASEAAQFQLMQKTGTGRSELAKIIKAWGLEFDGSKVAADISYARRVQFGPPGQGMVTEFVAWLGLDQTAMDQADILSSGINTLNVASAGALKPSPNHTTTITPIIQTSANAMEVSSKKMGMGADPLSLLRNYERGGKHLILAARVSGEAKTAFPDGAPSDKATDDTKTDSAAKEKETTEQPATKEDASEKTPGKDHIANGKINAIVVGDTDILADRFWASTQQLLGQQVTIPTANNASFVVGALENLTGSEALIALRGRGIKERPFTLVDSLRRDAERKFREKEQALTDRLKKLEQDLTKMQSASERTGIIMSEAERKAVETARSEMLATRRELRQVKLALRQSIDSLEAWLQFANIALVPILIVIGGIAYTAWRRRKSAAH